MDYSAQLNNSQERHLVWMGETLTSVRNKQKKWLIINKIGVGLFWLITLGELYLGHYVVIPYQFSDSAGWFRIFMFVFVWFVCLQGYANWFCIRYFQSKYKRTSNDLHISSSMIGHHDKNSYSLLWKQCESCHVTAPPRSHHCFLCRACILKRDHHCFMTGVCIGFHNQRFFTMLNIYSVISCFVGWPLIIRYMYNTFPDGYHTWDYLLPLTLYHCIVGNLPPLHLLLSLESNFLLNAGMTCAFFLIKQIKVILKGITSHEDRYRVVVLTGQTHTQHITSVLGPRWFHNLVFPFSLLTWPEGDGITWGGYALKGIK